MSELSNQVVDQLIAAARKARDNAHAPYSKFAVGAALRTNSGVIVPGCNVECASYGLTICAERNAVFRAVADGVRDFAAVAVIADTDDLTPPCGACRQVLWEFCGDVAVLLANGHGKVSRHQLSDLLPHAFDGSLLSR